jgi:hypothetical protein
MAAVALSAEPAGADGRLVAIAHGSHEMEQREACRRLQFIVAFDHDVGVFPTA